MKNVKINFPYYYLIIFVIGTKIPVVMTYCTGT